MSQALAFAGQRMESLSLGGNGVSAANIQLKAVLLDEIMNRAAQGYDTFYCGAARGADMLFGNLVLWVKVTTYPALRLICVIPHEGQATNWPEEWRDMYFKLLEQADDMVLISHRYTSDCYHRGNRYMIENAKALLALYDGIQPGDAAYAVEYARRKGREIVLIDPDTQKRGVVPPRLEIL